MYGDGWIQMLDSETGMIRNHFYCIVRYTEWQSSNNTIIQQASGSSGSRGRSSPGSVHRSGTSGTGRGTGREDAKRSRLNRPGSESLGTEESSKSLGRLRHGGNKDELATRHRNTQTKYTRWWGTGVNNRGGADNQQGGAHTRQGGRSLKREERWVNNHNTEQKNKR